MADLITLRAETREKGGKGPARAARRAGRVPGIIYGDNAPPILISVDPRELAHESTKEGFFARLVSLDLHGTTLRAIPREVQLDPASDRAIHVDFMRVGAGSLITVAVPVHFTEQAKSPGLRRGGILNVVRHAIDLRCPVDAIPDSLTVSLDGLDIGDSIHISAVILPPGTRPTISGRNFTVASIAAPTAVREEQAAAVAAAAAAGVTPEGVVAPGAPGAAPGAAPAPGAAAAGSGAAPARGAAAPARGGQPSKPGG